MSKIDKLLISGIRSFDNNTKEVIQFHTPLTLIVGFNGSGKTTIIECLKYATTGELPPNSKGGAFIHDPKLCGQSEVLAQVKLSFRSTTGASMVAIRNLQLTVKKASRSQKTLEGNLVMVKNGERTSVSSRVAELDTMLPQYLGVSKAILDSVIFCHQDESLWPMSEPSVLKKRFDEIFEALKYTKAIDNIKALRKKQNEQLKQFKTIEEHAKSDKDKADKVQKKSDELAAEIERLKKKVEGFHNEAKEAGDKATAAFNRAARYTEAIESLKAARKNREWYQRQLQDLRQDLKERPESDEWLESELAQYEERMKVYERRQQDQAKRFDDVKNDISRLRKNQSDKRVEAGKYEQQKVTHDQKIKDRESEIKQSARDHNIRGYDTDLDDAQINDYMERIAKLSKDQDQKVDRLKKENAHERRKVQEILDGIRERRSALQEGKNSAKQQVTCNDKRVAAAHSQIESITMDEGGKAVLEANIEDLESKLGRVKQDLSASGSEKKTKEANRQLQELDEEAASLNRELIRGTKRAGDLARLDHLKKESKDRQRSLETMKGAHGTRLENIVGKNWSPTSLEAEFHRIMEQRKQRVVEAERQRDGVSRELEQLDFKLRTARKELKRKEDELENCASFIRDKTNGEPPEDYPEVLAAAESDRDIRRGDVEAFNNMKKYFNECIDVAKSDHPACRLCSRAFHDDKSIRQFIQKLEKSVSRGAIEGMQVELRELEAELQKTKEASTTYDTWIRLSEKEIPALKAEISKYDQHRHALIRNVEQQDETVTEVEEARRDAETLAKPVASIVKCHGEFNGFESQIRELNQKQKDIGLSRTLEDVQEQIEAVTDKSKDLRSKIAKLQTEDQIKREQISSLGIELGNAKNKLTNANHELEKRESISKQISELKKSSQEQRETTSKLDAQLTELAPRFAKEEERLEDIRRRGDMKERELLKEAAALSDTLRSLRSADQEIRSYLDAGGPAKLSKCEHDIQAFDQQISSLETELKQVTVGINKIREELSNQDVTKRIISDNLKSRKTGRDLKNVEAEIEKLAGQNAEADQEHHRKEGDKWQREHNRAQIDKTSTMGTMKAMDNQLMELLKDWDTDYKDAAAKYRQSHIEVETTKAAVDDLGRYATALDKAIMKYHSLKMEEINRIIEELWKRTYQGTDVDTILIRSNDEMAKGNRSYNYRVCMIKQDAEMDMRGRCSAGQKLLASIIIRLALAECFCVNCGLIALDEPTTNLDRDNIRSLAESLNSIIKHRRAQNNFQLIVITHDEDFLRYMKCAEFCDTYWRISRSDRQKSEIKRQSIAEVL